LELRILKDLRPAKAKVKIEETGSRGPTRPGNLYRYQNERTAAEAVCIYMKRKEIEKGKREKQNAECRMQKRRSQKRMEKLGAEGNRDARRG
jgi:hypothetical protein